EDHFSIFVELPDDTTEEQAIEHFKKVYLDVPEGEKYYLVRVEKTNVADTLNSEHIVEHIQDGWHEDFVETTFDFLIKEIGDVLKRLREKDYFIYDPIPTISKSVVSFVGEDE